MRVATLLAAAAALALVAGCKDEAHDHDHGDHPHVHKAPHGGALVELGEEAAHVEFLLDATAGKLTAYVLDGEAEKAVRVAEPGLSVRVLQGADAFDITLKPVASALTGETAGDTSQFELTDARMGGRTKFEAMLKSITVKGQTFSQVKFRYPEGNE
jgi:hypothetical protein